MNNSNNREVEYCKEHIYIFLSATEVHSKTKKISMVSNSEITSLAVEILRLN